MSAPKKPQQQKTLPLLDPNNVPEIFTNELTGIHVQDGNCHLTLSVVRPKHADPNINERERVVAARVVMPLHIADAMVGMYGQLKTAMKLGQMSAGPGEALN